MALSPYQHRLLYRIAQAYYVEGLTQQEIGQRFGLSRSKVSRLLDDARRTQVVSIIIEPPPTSAAHLENRLERRYGLDEVVVVATGDADNALSVARELAPAAASYLLRTLRGREVIAIAGGKTLRAMIDALSARSYPGITVVQMVGGMGHPDAPDHATEQARRLSQKLESRLVLLPAPGLVSSVAVAQALRSDAQIGDTLTLAANADLALVGLGLLTPESALVYSGSVGQIDTLNQAGAVGNIAYRCIDREGQPLRTEFDERIVGLSLEQIAAIPRVIAVAGGREKLQLIEAALRSGVLNVLITDEVVAESLLRLRS